MFALLLGRMFGHVCMSLEVEVGGAWRTEVWNYGEKHVWLIQACIFLKPILLNIMVHFSYNGSSAVSDGASMCHSWLWFQTGQLVGYKDIVVHVSLLEVFHDGIFIDLGDQNHVVHSALLHILTLPVVLCLKHTAEHRKK